MDFNSMSQEELKSFIDNQQPSPELVVEEKKEEPANDEGEPIKPAQAEPVKAEEPDSKEEKPDQKAEEPFFLGKSREDIIEMQRNATKKISTQGNEISTLRLELENLKGQIKGISENKPAVPSQKDPEEELLSQYSSEDLRAVTYLAKKEIQKIEDRRREDETLKIKEAQSENEAYFKIIGSFLQKTFPEQFNEIVDSILDDVKKSPETTLNKKGWLESSFPQYIPQKGSVGNKDHKMSQNDVTTRKVKAASVGSGNGPGKNSEPKKSISQMSSSEYQQYMKSQGIDLTKGVILA